MITFDREDMRFTYRIAGVALHEGRVLLHRAGHEDFWSLPGGRCEMREPSGDALRREMREELGVDVTVDRLLWVVENFFHYAERQCHELGLYYLMSFPAAAGLHERGETFIGQEGEMELIFRWHDLATINDLRIYPSFLCDRLMAIPASVEHITHFDEGSGGDALLGFGA